MGTFAVLVRFDDLVNSRDPNGAEPHRKNAAGKPKAAGAISGAGTHTV